MTSKIAKARVALSIAWMAAMPVVTLGADARTDDGVVAYAEVALRDSLAARYRTFAVEAPARAAPVNCAGAHFVSRELASEAVAPRMLVLVRLRCPDGAHHTVPVWFGVRAYTNALVAARDLRAGALVSKSDVAVKAVDVATGPAGLPAGADLTGMHTVQPIRAGTVLTRSSLRAEPDVTAQQPVVIRAKQGPVRVEAVGLALQNGRIGDRVQVINLSSGDTVAARVISLRAVEVLP